MAVNTITGHEPLARNLLWHDGHTKYSWSGLHTRHGMEQMRKSFREMETIKQYTRWLLEKNNAPVL